MTGESQIPRLLAYWEHIENKSVFVMSKNNWLKFGASEGNPVQIDVTQTPMSGVVLSASVLGAFAVKHSPSGNQIHIFRWDQKDAPSAINLDKYSVYEELYTHNNYQKLVKGAKVHDNKELRNFLHDNVIIVKEQEGNDHWLPALPGSAIAAMNFR